MTDPFGRKRPGVPVWSRNTIALALVGIVALAGVIAPGLSGAAAGFTLKKAQKTSLGNTVVVTGQGSAAPDRNTGLTVPCPAGHQATSGGADSPRFAQLSGGDYTWLWESAPVVSGSTSVGWYVEVNNASQTDPLPFTAYAVCAP